MDRKSVKHYHSNGNLKYEGFLKDDLYNGYGRSFHNNGIREYEGDFKDGLFHGKGRQYRVDGTLMYEGSFENGVFLPEYEKAPLPYEGDYLNGRFHGRGRMYYENKKALLYEGDFEDGMFWGEGTLYYENGTVKLSGSWDKGRYIYPVPDDDSLKNRILITSIDDNSYNFSTFSSHNQKIVSNRNGIFLTYIKSRNDKYTAQKWFLLNSKDNGQSFHMVYSSTDPTNPPCLETDSNDNLYICYPDFVSGHSCLMIFKADKNYSDPDKYIMENTSSGKVCSVYDPIRDMIYYFSNNGTFTIMKTSGEKIKTIILTKKGSTSKVEYPQLYVDKNGYIHIAWTTENPSHPYLYWSIHHIVSKDALESFETADGMKLILPVLSGEDGDSMRITGDDEFDLQTWLHNITVKDSKIHFIYSPHFNDQNKIYSPYFNPSMHYLRYDMNKKVFDKNIRPEFKGTNLSPCGFDGFFAHDPDDPGSPLFYTCRQGNRISCMVSYNNGDDWKDHALSSECFNDDIYAIGGSRHISKDGYILGSFTHRPIGVYDDVFRKCQTYFIRIKAK